MSWMFPLMLGGEARHPSSMLEYISVVYTKHSYVKFFLAPSVPDTFVSGHCPPGGCYGNATYIYICVYIYIYILPDVKIIHYFLRRRRKLYFTFEIRKSTQRPTKYYNSARYIYIYDKWYMSHRKPDRMRDSMPDKMPYIYIYIGCLINARSNVRKNATPVVR